MPLFGHAQTPQKRVAVLEFEVAQGATGIDRTYLSDRARSALHDAVRGLFVMTRESTEALLQANGKTMADCTGECEVQVGRKLGADFIVSGRVTRFGSHTVVSMRLFGTADGELLSSAEAAGKNADELFEAMGPALGKLLAPLIAAGSPPGSSSAPGARTDAATGPVAAGPATPKAPAEPMPPGTVCKRGDALDCHTQCERGNMESCFKEGQAMLDPFMSRKDREPQFRALFEKACQAGIADACSAVVSFCESLSKSDRQKFLRRACDLKDPESCLQAAQYYLDQRDPNVSVDLASARELLDAAVSATRKDTPQNKEYKQMLEEFSASPTDFVTRARGFYCARPLRSGTGAKGDDAGTPVKPVTSFCTNNLRRCEIWRHAATADSYSPFFISKDNSVVHEACAAQPTAWCYGTTEFGNTSWSCLRTAADCRSDSAKSIPAVACKQLAVDPE